MIFFISLNKRKRIREIQVKIGLYDSTKLYLPKAVTLKNILLLRLIFMKALFLGDNLFNNQKQ